MTTKLDRFKFIIMQTPLIIAIIASILSVLSIVSKAFMSSRQIKQLKEKNTIIFIENRNGLKYKIDANSRDPREIQKSLENLLHN